MILIDQGVPETLQFGSKRDIDSVIINAMNNSCSEEFESAEYIDIRQGQIFESECVKYKVLVLSSYQELTITQGPLNGPPGYEPAGYGPGYGQRPLNEPGYGIHHISMLISKYGEIDLHLFKLYIR